MEEKGIVIPGAAGTARKDLLASGAGLARVAVGCSVVPLSG
jgi:hypothetical protein